VFDDAIDSTLVDEENPVRAGTALRIKKDEGKGEKDEDEGKESEFRSKSK
jgi:hypothetical protein